MFQTCELQLTTEQNYHFAKAHPHHILLISFSKLVVK